MLLRFLSLFLRNITLNRLFSVLFSCLFITTFKCIFPSLFELHMENLIPITILSTTSWILNTGLFSLLSEHIKDISLYDYFFDLGKEKIGISEKSLKLNSNAKLNNDRPTVSSEENFDNGFSSNEESSETENSDSEPEPAIREAKVYAELNLEQIELAIDDLAKISKAVGILANKEIAELTPDEKESIKSLERFNKDDKKLTEGCELDMVDLNKWIDWKTFSVEYETTTCKSHMSDAEGIGGPEKTAHIKERLDELLAKKDSDLVDFDKNLASLSKANVSEDSSASGNNSVPDKSKRMADDNANLTNEGQSSNKRTAEDANLTNEGQPSNKRRKL